MSNFPFAGIVDRKELPDGPESWMNCSIELIRFNELYLTQDCLVIAQLFQTSKRNPTDDDYVHVVMWTYKLFLYNGHHRVIKATLKGDITIWGRRYMIRN